MCNSFIRTLVINSSGLYAAEFVQGENNYYKTAALITFDAQRKYRYTFYDGKPNKIRPQSNSKGVDILYCFNPRGSAGV